MANDKVASGLAETASQANPSDSLNVVVELHEPPPAAVPPVPGPSPASRQQTMAAMRSGFELRSSALKSKIASLGGTVTGEAWLNSTLLATLPKDALDEIAEENSVKRIDLPRALLKD